MLAKWIAHRSHAFDMCVLSNGGHTPSADSFLWHWSTSRGAAICLLVVPHKNIKMCVCGVETRVERERERKRSRKMRHCDMRLEQMANHIYLICKGRIAWMQSNHIYLMKMRARAPCNWHQRFDGKSRAVWTSEFGGDAENENRLGTGRRRILFIRWQEHTGWLRRSIIGFMNDYWMQQQCHVGLLRVHNPYRPSPGQWATFFAVATCITAKRWAPSRRASEPVMRPAKMRSE